MSLTFKNAKVLWSGGFSQEPISMSGDRIVDGNFKPIDLSGYLILPGIVDMHGDAFDHHIAPRPSAPLDISLAFPRIGYRTGLEWNNDCLACKKLVMGRRAQEP